MRQTVHCSECNQEVDPEGHKWECWMMGGRPAVELEREVEERLARLKKEHHARPHL